MKEFWEALNEKKEVSGRELVLAAVTCTLAGIIVGFVAAIPKHRPPMPPMPPHHPHCGKKKDDCDMFED